MNIFEELEGIKRLDSNNVLGAIGNYPKQIRQAWEDAYQVDLPCDFQDVDNITFSGMGGSALGPHLITSVYQHQVTKPMLIIRDYHLPPYVNQKSLVLLCSYSGNTEEVLSCGDDALKAGARIIGVTSGGKLAKFLTDHQLPGYWFDPTYNTAPPRYGSGYMTVGPLAMLHRLGLVKVTKNQIDDLTRWLTNRDKYLCAQVGQDRNVAKQTALKMHAKIPILIGAEFLEGSTHVFTNQINETGKNFASYFVIPELNHHLMEGLKFPALNPENLIFLVINSSLYSPQIHKRIRITKEVIRQHRIKILEFIPNGRTLLNQAFEVVQFGSYVTFYLAMLNTVDPSPNPWVDYLKNKLQ